MAGWPILWLPSAQADPRSWSKQPEQNIATNWMKNALQSTVNLSEIQTRGVHKFENCVLRRT